jgi:hypothetical protein
MVEQELTLSSERPVFETPAQVAKMLFQYSSERSKVKCYFRGCAGARGWEPYHLHVPIVMNSGSLNFLEPWGSVQACHGIALPLPYEILN